MNLKVSIEGLDKKSIDAAGSTLTTLTSGKVRDENSFNEPNKVISLDFMKADFRSSNVFLFMQVAPVINALKNASNKMNIMLPPYSLTAIDLLRKSNVIQTAGSDGVLASM